MYGRTIIIADKDIAYRGMMAGYFRKAGYHVETTGSTDHLIGAVREKRAQVLLLGSDFVGPAVSADLIHLLKGCNHQLQVVMMSDEISAWQDRGIRREGVFFHALKPANAADAGELGQAVACAVIKSHQDLLLSGGLQCHGAQRLPSKTRLINALPWFVGIIALIVASNYISHSAATAGETGSSLAVWGFLGFCATIVVGQLLPIFRVKVPDRVKLQQSARQNSPPREN